MRLTTAVRCLLVALVPVCATAHAGTIYVSLAGSDTNDGLGWPTAKKTVQAGLNAAAAGDQVWVAAGTYVENITLKAEVALYGGFAGGETDLSQRNWTTNVTILDGNKAGSVVTAPQAATATTRIDGFTIRNGSASQGGGIYCNSSSPTIANNTITSNIAGTGGGIYCNSSSPTITNNTITGNMSASYGCGICCYYSSPTITNNTIAGNTATSDGSGICCYYSSPTITNNTISGNTAWGYGGGIYCLSSSPTIANTIIAFNSSGIYRSSGTPTLRYCYVYGNSAYNYSGLTDPTGTNGNISADPQLADVARGNMHLQPTSPCVNAGDDTAVQADWTDIDGQARLQGTHVDIGADESDGTLWPAAPAILYVSPSGSDSNDGLSWSSAKRTVQAGVDAAGTGSQVWVAAGTYIGPVRLRFGIALYGGFAGSEADLSQRNWRMNLTILDANQAGSVVTTPIAATVSTRIDGFTIRNGKLSGVYCNGSSPMITNNTITGNTSGSYGGGIYCLNSSPTITSNTITGNTAGSQGGGIYGNGSSPTIANNTISGNTAASYGGGICCYSSLTITNNTITGNAATYGGGICCYSSQTITNNTITGNAASNSGGGVYCYASSSPTITDTIIAFNSSGIYRSGTSGTPALRYCCVYGNSAYNYSGLTDPTGTNGNLSVDPQFVRSPTAGADGKWATADDNFGDLHLQVGSPCINAGDTAFVPSAGKTDMDSQPRKIGARVDIGADEFWWTGDGNYDGYVNVGDLQALVAAWGSNAGPSPSGNWNASADCNSDGYVNVGDLQILVANWGQSLN